MARTARLLTICLLLAPALRCASTTSATAGQPEIQISQLPRSEFDVEQRGAVSVAYQMVVRNKTSETIVLRQLTMKTMGRSPYSLRDEAVTFNETIASGGEATVTFSMWAIPREERAAGRQTVWVRGTAVFSKGTANLATTFSQSFSEPD